MTFKLTGPEGIYAGLDALNLGKNNWKVQFDGGKDDTPVEAYGHGVNGTSLWLRFTVSQAGATVVIEGDWDLSDNRQTIKVGTTEANLAVVALSYLDMRQEQSWGVKSLGTM